MFISIIFLSAGYVRLELELRALKEKFEVIEQHVKTIGTAKDPPFLNKGNTYSVKKQIYIVECPFSFLFSWKLNAS